MKKIDFLKSLEVNTNHKIGNCPIFVGKDTGDIFYDSYNLRWKKEDIISYNNFQFAAVLSFESLHKKFVFSVENTFSVEMYPSDFEDMILNKNVVNLKFINGIWTFTKKSSVIGVKLLELVS